MQVNFILFSLAFVFGKKASMYSFWEFKFIMFWVFEFIILGLYALLWQQVLKQIDLSIAYLNKGVVIFWSLLWAVFIFHERITFKNILGACIIVIGISVVNSGE